MKKKSIWSKEISAKGTIALLLLCLVSWVPLLWFCGVLNFGGKDNISPKDRFLRTEEWRQREAEKRAYQSRRYVDRLRDVGQRIAARAEEVRMEKWKANFPWQPTTDPAVVYDPTRHHGGKFSGSWNSPDWPKSNDPPYMKSVDRAVRENYVSLKRFYADDVRFTVQFEQMYGILAEYGRTNNPVLVSRVFQNLWRYQNPQSSSYLGQSAKNSIIAKLSSPQWLNPHYYTDAGEEESREIAERLIEEIEGIDSLPRPFGETYEEFHIDDDGNHVAMSYNRRLNSGDPELVGDFLVPYEGWTEEYEEWQKSQHKQFLISLTNGDSSFKSVFPEYFPPIGIKDNKVVDRDGDPIRMSEEDAAFYIRGVTPRGEVIPFFWEGDGTVRVPTPAEIEEMLANGEIEVLTEEEAQEIRLMPPKPSERLEYVAPLTPEQELLLDIIKEQLAE